VNDIRVILGTRKLVAGYTHEGIKSVANCKKLLIRIIKHIGMTPTGEPLVLRYPDDDEGGGDYGYTIFQALKESYAVADVYVRLNYTRILVASCQPFDSMSLCQFLSKHIGPFIKGFGPCEL
jgi:hypothetical protein